ncbi:kinase-like domain-containing protein [Aspergillus minisclerotigenes]|uniref:Altered inheritance of mitochondria protein 9, mitochondrial n=1 Tax=Aspergillus minisclerotigenes TaxID=656917 RepID=A0A5N6J931_9EURO|nr:kinase-like domain-containing protein [Aspergillus minisclerotigenes]
MAAVRTLFHCKPPKHVRNITITSRVAKEELYEYTNGHFLINEEHQYRQRYVKFDLSQLCDTAAAVGGTKSPIVAIEKMEGGFCKALLMRKADGSEIVTKLPSKLAGPPKYSTVSEVATLKYVQQHTSIPVPRVLAWECDSSNSVGSEYILMEKAPGVQLYLKWGDMDGKSRLALTNHLVKLESQLASVHFPLPGSLYLRDSCLSWSECHPLPVEINPRPSLADYGHDLTKREISRISSQQKTGDRPYRRRNAYEEVGDLECAMGFISLLESHHKGLASISKPILWHTDLHLGNIHVSDEDPTQIVSIIDWQSIYVGSLFLQATWPQFLKPNDDYICGTVQPQLPNDFDELDRAEKEFAISTRDDALITKTYELRSSLYNNRDVYRSIYLPPVFREIFIRCGEASNEGTIGLRACLAEIYRSWSTLGLTGQCPLSFSEEQLQEINQEFQEYRDWHDLDLGEIQQRNKSALDKYIKEMSKHMSPEDARQMWPFLENI